MNQIEPINQTKLFGLSAFLLELISLEEKNKLPNKILLSGQKGLGKSTLAYHFINYILSRNEEYKYDINNFTINSQNHSFKTVLNKSNPNLYVIDVNIDKKYIDINQIRDLINNLNKSSFNEKPRFVLIDNIEFLNINSINALLKFLEEPNDNVHFILINNNKKILSTLLSRCLNFKIFLSNKENIEIANNLFNGKLFEIVNKDLINYYFTAGNIFSLVKFGQDNNYDLSKLKLKELIETIIKKKHYKSDFLTKNLLFNLIEVYFNKMNLFSASNIYKKYDYFMKRMSNTKKFNLDDESLFVHLKDKVMNG